MRLLLVSLLAALLPTLAQAASLTVVRVWPGYRTAESFARISEYFKAEENPGRQTILRTQATRREGFYFLVRLANPGADYPGATFELQVITPTARETRTFTFKADVPSRSHVFNFGLTGPDWPDATAHPVAWHLAVRSADGAELVQEQSFLWAIPDAPAAK